MRASTTASLLTAAILGGLGVYAYTRGLRPGNYASFKPSALTTGNPNPNPNLPPLPFPGGVPADALLTMRIDAVNGRTLQGALVAADGNGQHLLLSPPVVVMVDAAQATGVGKPTGLQ